MPIPILPILGGIGERVLDTAFGGVSTAKQAREQRAAADKQMAFQERMSSTAHQREVEDMRKAGLNPLFSVGGSGASTPGGAMADVPNYSEAALGQAASARANKLQAQQIKVMQEEVNNKKADTQLKEDNSQLARTQTSESAARTNLYTAEELVASANYTARAIQNELDALERDRIKSKFGRALYWVKNTRESLLGGSGAAAIGGAAAGRLLLPGAKMNPATLGVPIPGTRAPETWRYRR